MWYKLKSAGLFGNLWYNIGVQTKWIKIYNKERDESLVRAILKEYKNNNKTIESLVDTLLTITSLDKLKQMIEDYDRVGDN